MWEKILKPLLFVSDIFSNRAGPDSGPYDGTPWTDRPEQVHNGKVVQLFSKYYTYWAVKSDIFIFSFRYKAIVKYKTAFYSFYLPVAAAMYIVSKTNLWTT